MDAPKMENCKVVVIGNVGCGKTCMILSFTTGAFPGEYMPTCFDNPSANVLFEGRPTSIGIWDTAGQEDYDRLRPLSYPQTDVFLICFSILNRQSLLDIKTKWIPEIQHHCPAVPFLLVGLKEDLRTDPTSQDRVVSEKEIETFANSIEAKYCLCSALTHVGVKEAWDAALEVWGGNDPATRIKKQKILQKFGWTKFPKKPVYPTPPYFGSLIKSTFVEDMKKILVDQLHSDVEFLVTDPQSRATKNFNCHKFIIEITNPKLFQSLTPDASPNSIESDFESFQIFLTYLYTQTIPVNAMKSLDQNQSKNLLLLSQTYDLSHLASFISKTSNVTIEHSPFESCKFEKIKSFDVTFLLQHEKVNVNWAMITVRCPFFESLFQEFGVDIPKGTRQEIPFEKKISHDQVFVSIIEYLYTDNLTDHNGLSFLFDVHIQSHFFMLDRLRDLVERKIMRLIDVSNVLMILPIARDLKSKNLVLFCEFLIISKMDELKMEKKEIEYFEKKKEEIGWPTKIELERWEMAEKALGKSGMKKKHK